ncbi:peptide methionine sulfoxide reductase MsrA [Mycena galericulata]|nr:peptide methionine sulfoxide reductase MsrA [Mycena galericulata]
MLSRLKSLVFRTPFDAAAYSVLATATTAPVTEIATFASGCFWGTQHIFLKHFPPTPAPGKGILRTTVGYTGGNPLVKNPDYKSVCTGATDHAEAVKIEFDPRVIGYAELVEFFYRSHDPTTLNKQGADTGTQYRSAIFTNSEEQLEIAQRVTKEVQAKHFTPKVCNTPPVLFSSLVSGFPFLNGSPCKFDGCLRLSGRAAHGGPVLIGCLPSTFFLGCVSASHI